MGRAAVLILGRVPRQVIMVDHDGCMTWARLCRDLLSMLLDIRAPTYEAQCLGFCERSE